MMGRQVASATGGSRAGVRPAIPAIVGQVLRSPGRPLDAAARGLMEARFGHDFGNVRAHADDRAAESARAVNAKAYAVGNDIVFNRGEYQPRSAAGLRSLAHELTHVMQQTAEGTRAVPDDLRVGAPQDAAEREAAQVGLGGWPRAGISVQEKPRLRRQPKPEDEPLRPGDEAERRPQTPPEKKPPPILHKGDYVFDPKLGPLGPLEGGSLEDLNKALHSFDQEGLGNQTCPPGWRKRADGLCCEGSSMDIRNCCAPYRLTNLGRCCPTGHYASGSECVKFNFPIPDRKGTPGKQPPSEPLTRGELPSPRQNVLPHTPLTVSFDIYFKQNQPRFREGS